MKKVDEILCEFRAGRNYDRDAASLASGLRCAEPTRAKQAFIEECDINTIVRRFRVSGELPSGVRMPSYGDFSQVVDFQSAMNAIALAHEAFDQMPADIRFRFHNDPAEFVAFCSDDKNRDEAVKLGLVQQLVAAEDLAGAASGSGGDLGGSGTPGTVT
ncbi:MAG: internal scaffolding protein [Microviridae sp.]|nr:MAG: internal scaffolding protein [Microviridae sp.]